MDRRSEGLPMANNKRWTQKDSEEGTEQSQRMSFIARHPVMTNGDVM